MSKNKYEDLLDEEILGLLGESIIPVELGDEQKAGLQKRVMQRIDEQINTADKQFVTVRADEGDWIELSPKIRKKLLFIDPDSGAESYLLQADPGAEASPHVHEFDEHCLVLEGDVVYAGGDCLKAGDYHFAPAGTAHGIANTKHGVLVYIQTHQQTQAISY